MPNRETIMRQLNFSLGTQPVGPPLLSTEIWQLMDLGHLPYDTTYVMQALMGRPVVVLSRLMKTSTTEITGMIYKHVIRANCDVVGFSFNLIHGKMNDREAFYALVNRAGREVDLNDPHFDFDPLDEDELIQFRRITAFHHPLVQYRCQLAIVAIKYIREKPFLVQDGKIDFRAASDLKGMDDGTDACTETDA